MTGHNRQRDDLRNLVRVQVPDRLLDVAVALARGFDQQRHLDRTLDVALSAINRADRRQSTDARGQSLLDQHQCDAICDCFVRTIRQHK